MTGVDSIPPRLSYPGVTNVNRTPTTPFALASGIAKRWTGLLVPFVFALVLATPAGAQSDPQRAAEIYELGVEAFQSEDFAAAATLFRRAWELDPNALLAFNVARAYERDGNLEAAEEFYRIAGEDAEAFGITDRVQEALARIEALRPAPVPDTTPDVVPEGPGPEPTPPPRSTALTGTVSASSQVPGARLRIRGQGRWDLPANVELPPGSYEGEVTSPGHRNVPVAIWVEPGEVTRVDARPEPTAPNATRAIAGWSALGGGAVLAGAGVLFYMQASNRYDEAASIGRIGIDRAAFDSTVDAGRRNALLSNVFYGLGAAAAITGVTLLGMEWFGSGPDSPRISAGPTQVQLDWSF